MAEPSRRWLIATTTRLLLVVGLLAGSGWVYLWLAATAPKVQATDASRTSRRVIVFEARQVPVSRQWSGYGVGEAVQSSDVPARVSAVVASIPQGVFAGAYVKRGQTLLQLDASDFERQVQIAQQDVADIEAQLDLLVIDFEQLTQRLKLDQLDVDLALQELRRVEQLQQSGAAHEQDHDRAKRTWTAARRSYVTTQHSLNAIEPRRAQLTAQYEAKRAHYGLARVNLERCEVVSPLDGILQSVDVEVGENVVMGQRIARVVDLSQIEVPLRLPAEARSTVWVGDKIEMTMATAAGHGDDWSATVVRIAPQDDPDTRTVTVFGHVQQPDWRDLYPLASTPRVTNTSRDPNSFQGQNQPRRAPLLVPGTFVSAVVASGRHEPRWVVPRRAIHNGRVMIATATGDTAEPDGYVIVSRSVRIDYSVRGVFPQLGVSDDQWAVLESPLNEGQWVLVNASALLLDGQAVVPVVSTQPSAKPTATRDASRVGAHETPFLTENQP